MWSTTLHQGQFHRILFFCCVLLCYVLLCDLPPFIKVNSTASYSFVVYCYVMYCYVIYHPSSRSIPPLLILLLCIVMLCIVRSRTTLHHSQFHQVKVIRNSEVLLPNFLWWVYEYMRIWVYEIYHYIHSMTPLSLSPFLMMRFCRTTSTVLELSIEMFDCQRERDIHSKCPRVPELHWGYIKGFLEEFPWSNQPINGRIPKTLLVYNLWGDIHSIRAWS